MTVILIIVIMKMGSFSNMTVVIIRTKIQIITAILIVNISTRGNKDIVFNKIKGMFIQRTLHARYEKPFGDVSSFCLLYLNEAMVSFSRGRICGREKSGEVINH